MDAVAAHELREREDRAVALRSEGKNFDAIARELGYAEKGAAFRAYQRGMDRVPAEQAREVRQLASERLEHLWSVAFRETVRDHVALSFGRLVKDEHGVPLIDHAKKLEAVKACLLVLERQARMLGLDAPARKQLEVITQDAVDAEISRLERELGDLGDRPRQDA